MLNRVLWTLDNEITGSQFERLCIDLLFRNGYRDIVPIEPQDGGRDAEEYPARGRGRAGEPCYFQFSLETGWRQKLRRDMKRVHAGGHRPTRFVFVTSRKARGVDRDAVSKEATERYGWELTVFSREWLRLQLEEAHPDLAQKYLGVDDTGRARPAGLPYPGVPLEGKDAERARAFFDDGDFERAAVELRDILKSEPDRGPLWEALAWSQYQLRRYDEAMASVNQAIKLADSVQVQSIRGCILAERGVERHDRAALIEAKEVFLGVVVQDGRGTWVDWYNLGNVLSALGQHQAAIEHYRQAVTLAPDIAEVWKNLANTYHLVGDHKEEMVCIDRALELDPLKPEALASKGVSLLVDFQEAEEAAAHLEKALSVDETWSVRWPHIWYWLAEAYAQGGRWEDALQVTDEGLSHQPGQRWLRRQKSDFLEKLLESDPKWAPEACRFWESALEVEPRDFTVRRRLIRALLSQNDYRAVWRYLDDSMPTLEFTGMPSLEASGFGADEVLRALEFLPEYARFRSVAPIERYRDGDDPVYGLPFELPWNEAFAKRLAGYLAVPFGLLLHDLCALQTAPGCDATAVGEVFQAHATRVVSVMTEASRGLACFVPINGGLDEKSNAITTVVMFVGVVGLREFGAGLGTVRLIVDIPEAIFEAALDAFPYNELEADLVSGCILPLNDEIGFAPDESE